MLDFLGIGAQKAGTTWTYENLLRHPEVYFPGGKEVHFWDEFYSRGLDWYKSLFPGTTGKKNGEITPAYAILPIEKIREIHALNPRMRIFYTLRDPIERAWSAALMEMGRAGLSYDTTPDAWFMAQFNSPASKDRGNYQRCLENWLGVFPREQMLILKFEDIAARPHDFMQSLAAHLGVDPEIYSEKSGVLHREKVFANAEIPIRPSLLRALEAMYGA